jgi:hypothetical protein
MPISPPYQPRFEIQFATGCKIVSSESEFRKRHFGTGSNPEIAPLLQGGYSAMADGTVRLTVAQAIVRYLMPTSSSRSTAPAMRMCGGGFGIFGHGNVTCLGEALYDHRAEMPLYRGQNEQSMGFAAAGLRQVQCASSASCSAPPRPGRGRPTC